MDKGIKDHIYVFSKKNNLIKCFMGKSIYVPYIYVYSKIDTMCEMSAYGIGILTIKLQKGLYRYMIGHIFSNLRELWFNKLNSSDENYYMIYNAHDVTLDRQLLLPMEPLETIIGTEVEYNPLDYQELIEYILDRENRIYLDLTNIDKGNNALIQYMLNNTSRKNRKKIYLSYDVTMDLCDDLIALIISFIMT